MRLLPFPPGSPSGMALAAAALLLALAPAPAQEAPQPASSPTPAIPAARPLAEYARLMEQSPFSLATAAATPPPQQPAFFQNLYLSAISRVAGRDCIFIASRDGTTRYALYAGEPGPEGLTVEGVDLAPEVGKTKVRVRKGAETGVLEFDQAAIQRPAAPVAATAIPKAGTPGQPQTAPQRPNNSVEIRRRLRMIQRP